MRSADELRSLARPADPAVSEEDRHAAMVWLDRLGDLLFIDLYGLSKEQVDALRKAFADWCTVRAHIVSALAAGLPVTEHQSTVDFMRHRRALGLPAQGHRLRARCVLIRPRTYTTLVFSNRDTRQIPDRMLRALVNGPVSTRVVEAVDQYAEELAALADENRVHLTLVAGRTS